MHKHLGVLQHRKAKHTLFFRHDSITVIQEQRRAKTCKQGKYDPPLGNKLIKSAHKENKLMSLRPRR